MSQNTPPEPLDELIERIRRRLEPFHLHLILTAALPHPALLSLVHEAGLEFPGMRPAKVETGILAEALSEEFFNDKSVSRLVAAALDKAVPPENLAFLASKKDFRRFKRSLAEAPPDEFARTLWRLARTGLAAAQPAFDAALRILDQTVDNLHRQNKAAAVNTVMDKAKDAERLQAELEKAHEENRHLEKKLSQSAREAEDIQRKLGQRDSELREAVQKAKRLEGEAPSRVQREADAAEKARLRSDLARAAEESRSLQEELAAARRLLERHGRLKRVGLFVDFQNLQACGREAFGAGPDFHALRRKVEDGQEPGERLLVSAAAYLAEDPVHEKLGLRAALQKSGFAVKSRPIIFRADGTSKGDWDLGMAVDILDHADRLDVIVIGTGDGDFLDLVTHLKEKKPHLQVEIACVDSPRHTSEPLLRAADRVHRLGPKQMVQSEKLT